MPGVGAAIFVTENGNDGFAGTDPTRPLRSIGQALEVAQQATLNDIYIGSGNYPGNVLVNGLPVRLLAGWSYSAGTWSRQCGALAPTQTTLFETDGGPVLTVLDAGVVVRSLTLQTRVGGLTPSAQPGASRIGLLARNATVRLERVEILASDALPGGAGLQGVPASGALPCNGLSDCNTGSNGVMPTTPNASDGGRFTPTGFISGDGLAGQPGTDGANGTAGSAGVVRSGCYVGCGCSVNCMSTGPLSVQGTSGTCGCGGRAGGGGTPGRGGGASVAILASASQVVALGSRLEAGRGGNGADGGVGGQGILGTTGTPGMSRDCQQKACRVTTGSCANFPNVACYYGDSEADQINLAALGGASGGPGGRGATGQAGGAGAGGPSISVVLLNGATLSLDAGTVLVFRGGGVGGAGARNGDSAPVRSY